VQTPTLHFHISKLKLSWAVILCSLFQQYKENTIAKFELNLTCSRTPWIFCTTLYFLDPQNRDFGPQTKKILHTQVYITAINPFQGAFGTLGDTWNKKSQKIRGSLRACYVCLKKKSRFLTLKFPFFLQLQTSSFNFNFNSYGWDGMRCSYSSQCALQHWHWLTLLNSCIVLELWFFKSVQVWAGPGAVSRGRVR
jgi:hypothetical protein